MNIDLLFDKFSKKIHKCAFQINLSKDIISAEKNRLKANYSEQFESDNLEQEIYWNNEVFYSWNDGRPISYGQGPVTLHDLWNGTFYYHNKVYQWLLATSFEAFEEYLKKSAPILNIEETLSSASLILKKIRNRYPKYVLEETIDNCFLLMLIERMRHHIVHCSGRVSDYDLFIRKILEPIGIYNDGHYDVRYKSTIDDYFKEDIKGEIVLLEIPVLSLPGLQAETTVLNNLFSVMLNSAFHIKKLVVS
jgi:hypothetical protein